MRSHVLDVPFAMRGVAAASAARWDKEHGVFLYEGAALPAALAPFRAQPYSWEMHVQRELAEAAPAAPSTPDGAIVLRAHQQAAVRAIGAAVAAKLPGFLLADDVGLGKTITAWSAILAMRAVKSVLIVCPLAVIAHWRRTIEAMGDGGKDIVVLNYDRLGKLFEVSDAARKKIRTKKGLARAGTAPELDVIVLDESHRCKNPTAARSKLAAKLVANAGFTLWLSATAGQNPLELSYLAPLLARVTGANAKDLKDFEQWCIDQKLGVTRGNFGKWEWRGDRADCERVRVMLFERGRAGYAAGIRRRPEEIAGWPAINRILTPIELSADARALYEEAWTAFRRELELAPRGKDPKGALAATLRLRQKSSLIRAAGTVDLARELLENGHQVAISVSFLETLTALRESFESGLGAVKCAAIHGGVPAGEREAERLRFQRGEARVVLFTVEEGISLHQGEHNDVPRSEIIHDLRWSAIQMAQVEGRCHRDGRFAQVYWAYADGTIEDKIARVVARRLQAMKEMIGDDVETLREIESLLVAQGQVRMVEQELLDAIVNGDGESRPVYADWLELHGHLDRAELLRLQEALRRMAATDPATRGALATTTARLHELAASVDVAWRTLVTRPVIEGCAAGADVPCPGEWGSLGPTRVPAIRACGTCNQAVYYCQSEADALYHSSWGRCVALDLRAPRTPGIGAVCAQCGRVNSPIRYPYCLGCGEDLRGLGHQPLADLQRAMPVGMVASAPSEPSPRPCIRCGHETPAAREACGRCGLRA